MNTINWFEIPASDITRAMKFYTKVLEMKLETMEFEGTKMCIMAHSKDGVGGALVEGQGYTPSDKGPLVYLNGGDDLAIPLARVVAAGGKIVLPKTSIGSHGFCAQFIDTEGNRLAFHSMK